MNLIPASTLRHKAKTDLSVRPSEERGPSPNRAMDAVLLVPGSRQHLELRKANPGEEFRSVRLARQNGQVHCPQKLDRYRFRRHASPDLQLQHHGASSHVRSAQRLREVHHSAPNTTIYSHVQRWV